MRIDIITCLPGLLEGPFSHSILKRAQNKGLVEVIVHDLRAYSINKHRTIDDYAYGGGAGMVLMIEPIAACIRSLQMQRNYNEVIFMSPDGEKLNQSIANELSLDENLLILCGHYKGVDERVRQHFITREISIGDYVISGGELAAAVLADAVLRLIPGVMSDETSALSDSFQDGLVAPPVYTRPVEFEGLKVPDVLLSGHEKLIEQWRFDEAVKRTRKRRPDLLND
ncbi:MAG: tRNA (guanosine(37)-N1)-methyltransferase TrmD [Bacteroidota bacterium]|jgi:tRNA (guanine37-N1)-methyltransferase|nr:tRNA (guanosine(37)-N1)-methyltransferase TrmD [Bacteroidota bacterium]